jgi:hypothetical protein
MPRDRPCPGRGRNAQRIAATAAVCLAVAGACGSPPPEPPTVAPEMMDAPGSEVMPTASTFSGPLDEYLPRLADCLQDAGWDVTLDDQNGLSVGVTAAQREAFQAARDRCVASLGEPPTPAPLSEQQIRARYDYLVEARQCLLRLGYTISEPPSVEQFLDTYVSSSAPWSPYNELADETTQGQWEQATAACPQTPNQ